MQKPPEKKTVDADSITIIWKSWLEPVSSQQYRLVYEVQYKEETSSSWSSGEETVERQSLTSID